jgi:hypothetical protein
MTSTPAVLAEVTDYDGLIEAIRQRIKQRRIAVGGEDTAKVAGLPDSYLAKLTSPQPIRRLGAISMGPVLGLLGLKLLVVEDEEALKRLSGRLSPRDEARVRSGTVQFQLSTRFMRRIQRLGGRNSRKYMSTDEARVLAVRAAKARWSKRIEE